MLQSLEIANYTTPNQYQGTITSVTPITHTGGASISAKFLGTSPCSTSGSQCDSGSFDYNASCGTAHLVPAPGNANSWDTWLQNQNNAFNTTAGCYQFGAIQSWISDQLTPTISCANGANANGVCWNNIQITRKQAKSDWAACMQQECTGGTQNGC